MLPLKPRVPYSMETRKRIISAYEQGVNWLQLSNSIGVHRKTAVRWIRRHMSGAGLDSQKRKRRSKLNESEVEQMLSWVAMEPTITFTSIRDRVKLEFGKEVAITTVGNYLDGQLITVNKTYTKPEAGTPSEINENRKWFLDRIQSFEALGRKILWLDEITIHLRCARHCGRSLRIPLNTEDPNIHIICLINTEGPIKYEVKSGGGAFTSDWCLDWMDRVLNELSSTRNDTVDYVLVCDGSLYHANLEAICTRHKVELVRLEPYSPTLNPVESVWSAVKRHIREQLSTKRDLIMAGDPNRLINPQKWRLQFLEQLAQDAESCVTPNLCADAVSQVKQQQDTHTE